MPLDPNISLQVGQGGFGPDWRTIITMQQLGQRMQMQQEELKGVNALRSLYGNPQNVDEKTNQLTPNALKQLYQQAPLMGMQYSQNALQMQERQARGAVEGAKINEYVRSDASRMRDEAISAYDLALRNGLSPDAAKQRVQDEIYTPWYQQTMKSGLLSPDQARQIHPDFDVMRARQNQQAERMAAASAPPTRAEALKEKEFELKKGEGKVETDYGRSPPVQFLRFPDNRTTDITGKNPYTPTGVGETKGKEADLFTGRVGDKTVTVRPNPTGGWIDADKNEPVTGVTDIRKVGTGGGAQDRTRPAKQIAVVDKDGNVVQRLAANEPVARGQPWTQTGTDTPIIPPPGGHIDVGQTGGVLGSRENTMISRQLEAGITATTDLENVSRMPSTVSAGPFGGRKQGPGLVDALKENLANKLTGQQNRIYTVALAGLRRGLATIETQGLAPGGAFTGQMDAYEIKETDDQLTALYKLAGARQVVENGMEVLKANDRVGPQQRKLAEKLLDRVRVAIPWTTSQVQALDLADDPKATLRGVGLEKTGQSGAPAATVGRTPTTTTPSGIGIYQP